MPRYNIVLEGLTADKSDVVILPQAEKLIFNNTMYNLEVSGGISIEELVRLYNEGCVMIVYISKMFPLKAIDEFQFERIVDIMLFKGGKCLRMHFNAVCKAELFDDDNDMQCDNWHNWRWECVQRFMKRAHWWMKYKRERRLALAMSTHQRLGSNSLIKCLSVDVMTRLLH